MLLKTKHPQHLCQSVSEYVTKGETKLDSCLNI